MDLLWIASLKLIIFTDIRTIKGLKTKMSGFDVFSNMKKKLPQIKRIFSRIDLFSKKECAGGT